MCAESYTFLNQGQLGERFGVTSHQIGRWLDEIGLRENKRPSSSAFQGGYVDTAPTGRAACSYYYVWHQDKTVKALVEAGHSLVGHVAKRQTDVASLVGPFSSKPSSEDGFEIVDGNGVVSVWVRGSTNTEMIVRLMNLAYKWGKLSPASIPLAQEGQGQVGRIITK